jgi:tetratricopeptide (TPR) repeat protein
MSNMHTKTGSKWAVVVFGTMLWTQVGLQAAEQEQSVVHFTTSCKAENEPSFSQAITLLHSFEYPESTRLFSKMIEVEPGCAMAYWGAAMSIWHPLWAPPSAADLERGAALLRRTTSLEATLRERAYINALSAFYSSNDINTHRQRVQSYEAAMSDVYLNHLEDSEAAVFYALALLASTDPRDKSYANQFKSGALLNWVRETQPFHPGVLHYTIHSYDYPELAHLALATAKVYAQAAPDSAHAQHMPSHIFTRLGLWELSLSSNHDSIHSAEEYTQSAHLPGHYDEGLHSMDYLMYALLQMARDDDARKLLDQLAKIDRTDTENFKVAYTYAASPARFALERRQWLEAANLQLIRQDFDWQAFGFAQSIHYFARGIGAARSGQLGRAWQELAVIEKLQRGMPDSTLPYWLEEVQVHIDAVTAWILMGEDKPVEALSHALAAADREDAVDKHPVTPGAVLPARELYADMLMGTGDYAEALVQYRRVLASSPDRLNALLGAADAASHLGDEQVVTDYLAGVREQARNGNGDRYRDILGLAETFPEGEAQNY